MGSKSFTDKNLLVKTTTNDGLIFHSPDSAPFELTGLYWRKKGEAYRRMPLQSDIHPFSAGVNGLADFTSGAVLRFRSDARKILVHAKIKRAHKIVRMALNGTMGFDLYAGESCTPIFRKVSVFEPDAMEYTSELWSSDKAVMQNFSIYFPLYAELDSVEFGFNADAKIEKPLARTEKYIVAYGTSILHGACANRPGNSYPSMLGRYFNCPVLNLGFAGNAKGELCIAKTMSEVKESGLYIVDYDANVSVEELNATLEPFVQELRHSHPETPILLLSCIPFAGDIASDGSFYSERLQRLDAIHQRVYEKYKRNGDRNIFFLSGSTLLGNDPMLCSADGCHLSDLGFAKMAEKISMTIDEYFPNIFKA